MFSAFLYALLFSGGCIKESLDDCPPSGYNLFFYYPADGDTDFFDSYIDNVVLYVYDNNGRRVLTREFGPGDLRDYQGIPDLDRELPAGSYTFVVWGNAGGLTAFTGTEDVSTGRARQSQYAAGETVSDFDPLYFGRKTLTVNSAFPKTDTLRFVSSHINMEVHIAGYGELPDTRASGQGLIGLSNVPAEYDFSMVSTGEKAMMFPEWSSSVEDRVEVVSARFRLFRFPDDTDIVLYVYGAEGAVRAEIPLAGFLAENGISVEGVNEITVPIYILFEGPKFYVTVDDWYTVPVNPIP